MRRWKILLTIIASGFLGLSFLLTSAVDPYVIDTSNSITAPELRSIVAFLASDEMQGRETDTQANRIAGRYLAHEFELLGLEPAGDNGTYFQRVALTQGSLGQKNDLSLRSLGQNQQARLYYDFYPSSLSASGSTSGEIVFVGYGISAPQWGHDDYSILDATDRIALILPGEPQSHDPESVFEGLVNSEYSDTSYKILNAQRHGAKAVLLLPSSQREDLNFSSQRAWPRSGKGRFELTSLVEEIRIPVVWISPNLFTQFESSTTDLLNMDGQIDKKAANAFADVDVSISTEIEREPVFVDNVLALLSGSDRVLSQEAILIGAHFDHVGVRNGEIYNGADDDASGTAAVLEIAEAFALNPTAPQRSILFALWNAEEHGLLGSRFYCRNPTIPLNDTEAVFQLDMIGRNQEVNDPDSWRFGGLPEQGAAENLNSLHVIGHSRSEDLKVMVERANVEMGLDLLYELDNHGLNLIRRTDSWPFLISGIPAVFFTTGLHPDYHTSSDTADKLNYPKMQKVAQLTFLAAWQVANSAQSPQLNP